MTSKITNKLVIELFGPLDTEAPKLAPRDIQHRLAEKGIQIEPRTLRRRLAELVAQGELLSEGAGPATRYFPRPPGTSRLHFSPEAQSVMQALSTSTYQRPPSRFEYDFVQSYEPNKTYFLADTLRNRLLDLGRSADTQVAAGTYARDILDKLVVDLSWASSALEGNTYSLGDTKELIERGQTAEGGNEAEAVMILNHREAIRYLVERAETIAFDERTLFALHSLLADGLLANAADAGRVRRRAVAIGDSRYVPISNEDRIKGVLAEVLAKGNAIRDPYEQAFFAMAIVPYLQPFIDVNKRTSRLAANIPFIKHNLCPLSFIGVPKDAYIKGIIGIYELRDVSLLRDVFAHSYEVSCERYPVVAASLEKPDPTRLKYRDRIKSAVSSVVSGGVSPDKVIARVNELTNDVPVSEADAVRRLILDDLASLHAGNIARFRVSGPEFDKWNELWPDSHTRAAALRRAETNSVH